jgi:hypothetical protein
MPPKKDMGPDPDPTQYLFVSLEMKRQDQTKPYDGKKATWVPCEKDSYQLGEITGTKGDLVVVKVADGVSNTTFIIYFIIKFDTFFKNFQKISFGGVEE